MPPTTSSSGICSRVTCSPQEKSDPRGAHLLSQPVQIVHPRVVFSVFPALPSPSRPGIPVKLSPRAPARTIGRWAVTLYGPQRSLAANPPQTTRLHARYT